MELALLGIPNWSLLSLKSVALLVGAPFIVPCVEYVWYEFFIEPLSKRRARAGKPSLAGPYFERGPQDDEPWVW